MHHLQLVQEYVLKVNGQSNYLYYVDIICQTSEIQQTNTHKVTFSRMLNISASSHLSCNKY